MSDNLDGDGGKAPAPIEINPTDPGAFTTDGSGNVYDSNGNIVSGPGAPGGGGGGGSSNGGGRDGGAEVLKDRRRIGSYVAPAFTGPAERSVGPVFMQREQKLVTVDGRPVDLGPKVYMVLELLMLRSPGWVSTESIGVYAWGSWHEQSLDGVRIMIHHLRKSLGVHRGLIQNKRGFGYRIVSR